MLDTLRHFADIFLNPVPAEVKSELRLAWEKLPDEMKTSRQMFGTHGYHCGATIGAMPRCDFACQGCYLGEEANRIPAQPLDEIKRQLRMLRLFLGPGGNLQLTDGEVTLRPESELIEMIRYSRELGMIPMLMTHGDTFRRKPGLLERLMEAGLTEVSIHVDVEMRGRKGEAYKRATEEEQLNPLRDEFADILRNARKNTGKKIAAATTMTVTADNLRGVPAVMRWLSRNADAFKMISFQPIAQVGRTEEGLGGKVTVEDLWKKIAEGLYGEGTDPYRLLRGTMWTGHKDCNRYVLGLFLSQPGAEPLFEPFCDFDNPIDDEYTRKMRQYFGGINFRLDSTAEAITRVLGCLSQEPKFVLSLLPYILYRLRRMDPAHPHRLLWRLARGEAKLHGFNIVSHHFMSREELKTPKGQERLGLCMFKVPIDDRMVSMCEVNATDLRDRYYEEIRAGKRPSVKKSEKNGAPLSA